MIVSSIQPIDASEFRENMAQIMDRVRYEKPQVILRSSDYMYLFAHQHLQDMLKQYRFQLEMVQEEEGTWSGWLKEIPSVSWFADTKEELRIKIAESLIQYADIYIENFTASYQSPSSHHEMPYVLHVSIQQSLEDVLELID